MNEKNEIYPINWIQFWIFNRFSVELWDGKLMANIKNCGWTQKSAMSDATETGYRHICIRFLNERKKTANHAERRDEKKLIVFIEMRHVNLTPWKINTCSLLSAWSYVIQFLPCAMFTWTLFLVLFSFIVLFSNQALPLVFSLFWSFRCCFVPSLAN